MNSKKESPLLAKIRKLMAKASDPSVTEAEATAFAAKVQELLLREGLEMADIAASAPGEAIATVGEEAHDFRRWNSPHRRGLLDAVCAYYMCEVLYWRKAGMLRILGKPQNVEVAKTITDYLIETTVRLSTQYVRANPGANAIDFRRGCMLRLRERLMAERAKMMAAAQQNKTGNTLPVLFTNESALVKEYVKNKYEVRQTKPRPIKHGRDAWAGRAAAEGISLQGEARKIAGR